MNIIEATSRIQKLMEANVNVLLRSSPGIGKSELSHQIANSLGYRHFMMHPFTWDVADIRGLPAIVNDETKKYGKAAVFFQFNDLELMCNAETPTIFVFDDFGLAPNLIQGGTFQIVQERAVNGHKISDHARFMICTNNRSDSAGVAGLLTPLVNRFWECSLEPHAPSWVKWAIQNSIAMEVIAFIRFKPEMISTFDPKKHKDSAFASPRSLTMMAKLFSMGIDDLESLKGCVGEECAVQFKTFLRYFQSIAGLPEKIFANPVSAPIPSDRQLVYALIGVLANRANPSNWKQILTYSKRLEKESEVCLVVDTIARNKKNLADKKVDFNLAETVEFISFLSENQNIIQFA